MPIIFCIIFRLCRVILGLGLPSIKIGIGPMCTLKSERKWRMKCFKRLMYVFSMDFYVHA